jgi:hypothetical protein
MILSIALLIGPYAQLHNSAQPGVRFIGYYVVAMKFGAQKGKCAICRKPLRRTGAELDRIDELAGYSEPKNACSVMAAIKTTRSGLRLSSLSTLIRFGCLTQ